MNRKKPASETLGDKLTVPLGKRLMTGVRILLASLSIGLLVGLIGGIPAYGIGIAGLSLVALWLLARRRKPRGHVLLSNDKQGFVHDLRLSDKTALFDGNNILHFGIRHKIGPTPLWAIAHSLRSEGYRIVCFFDANIYFELKKYDELKYPKQSHSVTMLAEVFGLRPDEIYVVPSGYQADAFIIETLSHLPISFAVTNDRFRDYQDSYKFLAESQQWRKGVTIKAGEIRLYQHKFRRALRV